MQPQSLFRCLKCWSYQPLPGVGGCCSTPGCKSTNFLDPKDPRWALRVQTQTISEPPAPPPGKINFREFL